MKLKEVVQVAGSTLLLCLLGPVSINISEAVPFSLQTFFVLLPSMLFGWRTGGITVLLYLLAGGLGLPVFAGYSSGIGKFAGPGGGYLLAFPAAAVLAGWLRERRAKDSFLMHLCIWAGAHAFIIVAGITWQLQVTGSELASQLPLLQKLALSASVKSLAGSICSYWWKEPGVRNG